jgi:hypothetical protein
MFYYLYLITNLINNKIYIGVHKTKNMNDGYMGSGKVIRRAIAKYGSENFSKQVLEVFDNELYMFSKEAELVSDEFLARDDVYNLRRGGSGGNFSLEDVRKGRREANKVLDLSYIGKLGAEARIIKYPTLSAETANRGHIEGWFSFKGKKHSDYTKKIIGEKNSISMLGEGNSQYGTRWIYNLKLKSNMRIKNSDTIPDGWVLGRKMRFY